MTEEVERSGLTEESRNPLENAPPTNDVVFKLIFGDNRHKRVLLHFLNCCLPDGAPITDVEIVQTEITPEHIEGKLTRLDILAETDSKELINIEVVRSESDRKWPIGRNCSLCSGEIPLLPASG